MARYDRITIAVRYEKHSLCPEAHVFLNQYYGGLIEDPSPLFTDPNDRKQLTADAYDVLVRLLIDNTILPSTVNSDSSVVTPIFKKCLLKIAPSIGKTTARLSGVIALETALAANVAGKSGEPV